MVSFSSPVLTSTNAGNAMTGSKCAVGLKLRLSSSSGSRTTEPVDVFAVGAVDAAAAVVAADVVVSDDVGAANDCPILLNENRECDCVPPSANDTDGGAAGPEPLPNVNDANGLGFVAAVSDGFGVSVVFCVSFVGLTIGDEIGVDEAGFVMLFPKMDFCAITEGTAGDAKLIAIGAVGEAVTDATDATDGLVITYECGTDIGC